MQLTNIFTVLAVAMTAAAAPADVVARTGGGGGGGGGTAPCSINNQPVCCTSVIDIIEILTCSVNVLGGTCAGQSYCCETNAAPGTLVNIQALNCVNV
ncbi:hypothetical protein B0H63DRAFT_519917 [Podospora didyma]|uniref:Hydrophobin n=1 Tax=Podospora didyma TaxID=330526 RepID=A0AAE0NZV3_9PEZI|nr:hypothetical protein B0H63DRAFT_519917 [Podospora didyma]